MLKDFLPPHVYRMDGQQMHDELVLEAKTCELDAVEKIIREAMENVVKLKVPLIVDVHSGANWSLAK